MNWNSSSSKEQKLADRVLDQLQEYFDGQPVSRSLANSRSVNLQERMPGVRNTSSRLKKRWFDAR